MSTFELPIVDARHFLDAPDSAAAQVECRKAAAALKDYGCLLIRDPRVNPTANDEFLDMLEAYYAQPHADLLPDARPEVGFQVGVSPEFTEDPRCRTDTDCQELMAGLAPSERPLAFNGPDPKWRFFWRIGEPPAETAFPLMNAAPVVPQAAPARFPRWAEVMDGWGNALHDAGVLVAEMVAVGFGLPRRTFADLTRQGPHLLAPTGSDLSKYGEVGTVLAGFHYDLNFITLHGKSRYPGLHIWPRNQGCKLAVKVPDGCLLVQTGRQMEWLTGGEVLAGYHEVVVTEATRRAMEARRKAGREDHTPQWRVSSTFFLHIASDQVLKPLAPGFDSAPGAHKYPSVRTGEYVKNELAGIKLMEEYTEA
ncbi:hypothetical protein IWQ60_001821 [Tieghemiomyces parasiticus]|uniref:Isopenicillin N synthase-like Fe(2+) 2OG dioxygenase domain-containing protein n=1 Tax=Tieghemiomyces parasiticus TaxID=78921 RepID=A0A9W8DXX9_9FUNG|nr:hypothetical protein IWQ60_001821 [Tieghemiomyces parasiticus]